MSDFFYARFPVIKGSWLAGDLVYHCREDDTRFLVKGERQYFWSENVDEWEIRTVCGMRLDSWTREVNGHGQFTHLAADYAAAIARPCRRCWIVDSGAAE